METINKVRKIDPFFEHAVNQIFLNPNKTAFIMDGPIGVGKSSNFVMRGAYDIARLVNPIRKGQQLVRESKWAAVRESENSALATVQGLLGEAIFTPEIMAMDNSPIKIHGSHPAKITIKHSLPDDTILEMHIECHGFNNEKADNRLRTHEFLGAMIFEMQGVPFNIFEVTIQRCGRFRTSTLSIEKEIDGKIYKLSGLNKLAMVLCDINIPERPHPLYDKYYDVPDKSKLPYKFITPPPPLIHKSVNSVPSNILEKYPVTQFEGEKVVWLPNPKIYNMTRHFEEKDDQGQNIPWTGYNYWFNQLHLPDAEIRRYIIGRPDTVGGEAAVYGNFRNCDETVLEKKLDPTKPIYMGYDPGGYAAVEFCQLSKNNILHIFKEFYFVPGDQASTRVQFKDFVLPFIINELKNKTIHMVLDPASGWLGRNNISGATEDVKNMVEDEILKVKDTLRSHNIVVKLEPCRISNQNKSGRINSLHYFIDKKCLTVDPSCSMIIGALSGGYQKKKLKSGIISDNIDKDNPYSHPAEAVQYAAVNIVEKIKRALNEDKRSNKRRVYRIKRAGH